MSKKNLILGGILVALIALAYFYQGPWQNWQNKNENFFADLNSEQVNRIEVVNNQATTTEIALIKDEQGWKIEGSKDFYLEDNLENNLKRLLEEAPNAEFELVSKEKSKKRDFGTGERGVNVKLYEGGKELAYFTVGNIAPNFTSSYISQPDSDKTYSINKDLPSFFVREKERWYDHTIFASAKDSISKVRFQYPDQEFTVEKELTETEEEEEVSWKGTLPYEFSVDKENIDEIVNIMTNLEASEIPEQTFEGTGLEKHLIIVQATGEGVDNTIMVGEEEKEALETSIQDLR